MGLKALPKMGPNICPQNMERAEKNKNTMDNGVFQKSCEEVGIKPTIRQASRWNQGKGSAWKMFKGLV